MLTADLVSLSLAERIQAMEVLWDSLCREPDTAHATPQWHADVLRERAAHLANGTTSTTPWETAKISIREKAAAMTRTPQ